MRKKFLIIFVISIFSLIFIENIKADINSYGDSQQALASGACSGEDNNRACMSTEWYKNGNVYTALYGARVSLVDSTGKILKGPLNFWATKSMKDYINNLSLSNTMSYSNVYVDNTGLDVQGLRNIDSTSYSYAQYLSNMTEENVLAYLNHFYGREVSISEVENYYLKVEPIYVIQFLCDKGSVNAGSSCKNKIYYIGGTSYEILNFGFNGFSQGSSARNFFKYVALDKPLYESWGGNFSDNSKGLWNIIKNYALTTYINSPIDGTSFDYYNKIKSDSCPSITSLEENTKENVHKINQLLLNNTCNARSTLGVGYVTISKYLPQCEKEVSATDTIDRRIELYNEFGKKGLLNLGNITGNAACVDAPALTNGVSCLNGNANTGSFTNTNLSQYNQTIDVNGTTGYCLTYFNLNSQINLKNIDVISGKLITNTDNVVTRGILTKKCYVPGYNGAEINQNLKYSSFVGDVYLGNNKLQISNVVNDTVLNYNSSTGLYEASITAEYKFLPIYLERITGKIHSTHCTNCDFLSYGLLSNFKDKGIKVLPFSFMFNGTKYETTGNQNCSYNAIPEIVENNKLQLEFRSFKTDNAFPGKSGNSRKKGSNWDIYNLDYNKDNVINMDDLNLLNTDIINDNLSDLRYDINWDGEITKDDYDLIKEIIDMYVSTNGISDNYSETLLSYRPNSYGYIKAKNQTVTPKYVIQLTPSDITDIRKYNKGTSYDDYNLVCDSNGNKCTSNYLTELKNKGVLTINNSSKR